MPKRQMKKFQVTLELDAEDLFVWGDDAESVDDAIAESGSYELLDNFNGRLYIQVTEVPGMAASCITDGVATEDDGWTCLEDYTDEDGQLIEPTDEKVEDSGLASPAELEAAGQLRLPL
jgi:hypothetical protein